MPRQNRALLWATKECEKGYDYRYSRHKNGKIFLSQKEGDAVIVIKCEVDLQRLMRGERTDTTQERPSSCGISAENWRFFLSRSSRRLDPFEERAGPRFSPT
ncbi:hypothetical protein HPB47_018054 [Ixodes persulcatus]|uniref:Uncharacterized protein n=1 Tax=Ixodes persulcatus TaxID=34615 RepID=A0AC60QLX6_IXOPE|nr:hypothetical protein HPB47_018054 [Ixodes persulcatus]